MIDIEKFILTRKKLGLSQLELCDGICTQSTLSKFENNGRIPSLKILNSLCARMNINVSDIMRDTQSNKIEKKLAEADYASDVFDYPKVVKILSQIPKDELLRQEDIFHYQYLRGILALELEHNQTDALYCFNSILESSKLKKGDVYHLLALSGCGQVYEFQGEVHRAKQYYDLIISEIQTDIILDNPKNLPILSVLYHAGKFYSTQKEYQKSNKLLNTGYQICATQHVTYYLGRILFCLAQNGKEQAMNEKQIRTYINDAAAFARLYNNRVLLQKINQFQQNL
ncbi:MAG: helix-turn-helix transcriptional regulator [Lactobacillus sp.]|nr:helix-turn-helix transcriptional regulator [Lactobacillus sp.]